MLVRKERREWYKTLKVITWFFTLCTCAWGCIACACFFKGGYTCTRVHGSLSLTQGVIVITLPSYHGGRLSESNPRLAALTSLLTSLVLSQSPEVGMTSVLPSPPCLYVSSGHQTLILKLVKQALESLNHLPAVISSLYSKHKAGRK